MPSDVGLADLWICTLRSWTPGIGDPTLWGWVTVFAYIVVAAVTAQSIPGAPRRVEGAFWLVLTLGLALLAINKQLDLQSGLTAFARCIAKAEGWYEDRRRVQVEFILAIAAVALAGAVGAAWALRRRLRRLWPAVLGTAALLAFVVIRAAGFHHVDRLIGESLRGVTMNASLELGSLALIAWGAARAAGGQRSGLAGG